MSHWRSARREADRQLSGAVPSTLDGGNWREAVVSVARSKRQGLAFRRFDRAGGARKRFQATAARPALGGASEIWNQAWACVTESD
jgi:hypothetical protein